MNVKGGEGGRRKEGGANDVMKLHHTTTHHTKPMLNSPDDPSVKVGSHHNVIVKGLMQEVKRNEVR